MSSPDGATRPVPADLPPALSSMWRLCRLGYRHEPGLLLAAFLLSLFAALPDALIAVWLKLLGEGVLRSDRSLLMLAALGLAMSAAATWFLRTVSTRVQRRFRDKVTIALEGHVARLQASVTTIAHKERPELLDRRLDPAARGDHRAAGVGAPGAGAARAVRAADRAHRRLAAGRGAQRGGARRPGQPVGAAPVRHGDHSGAGQGGPAHRHRSPAGPAAARRVGTLVRTGLRRAMGQRGLAHARLGGVRRGLRRRDRLRRLRGARPSR